MLVTGPEPEWLMLELRAATAANDAAMDVTDCNVVILDTDEEREGMTLFGAAVETPTSWGKVTGGVSRRELLPWLLVPVLPLSDAAGLWHHPKQTKLLQ